MFQWLRLQQSRQGEEGLVCLAVAAELMGAPQELRQLRARYPVSQHGLTLGQLQEAAASLGFVARSIVCEMDTLRRLRPGTILQWGRTGFVVIGRASRRGGIRIFDPGSGWRRVSRAQAERYLTGAGLEISHCPPTESRRSRPALTAFSLLRWTSGIRDALVQSLLFSVFLQAYVVVGPMYMRAVVDDVVPNADADLLASLAVAFALLAFFNAGAMALRGLSVRQLSVHLNWDMTTRVFHHLVRLPLEWFQTRRLGDVLSRFQGVDQVRNVVSSSMSIGLDGALSATTLVMLALFSPPLAAISLSGLAIYIAIRMVAIPIALRLNRKTVVAASVEQGKRIETLRAIQSIKAMAAEPNRESDWAGRLAETIRAAQDSALATTYFSSLQALVSALTYVALLYVGARGVLQGSVTLGLLTAAVAYHSQFNQRAVAVFEQFVSWRMLDVQLDRLADIALEPVEPGLDSGAAGSSRIRGALGARELSFRYGAQDPFIIRHASFNIRTGEFVAISGPSGCGKTTLLKLLSGLYSPTEGQVLIDGRPLAEWGRGTVRKQLGIVMQDDQLLAGSIAENVSFFDEHADQDWVWSCLRSAGLEDEVQALPLNVGSLVGDLGASLSGGQKQRLLIARALYRRPRILLLDEATSHLDIAKERSVNATLAELPVTRIVVAHRPETIASADRVIRFEGGQLVS
jgi:ATP-binding cassette subfamily B protein RaxB